MPVVGETVTLELSASDGPGGSGVAFVRLSTRERLLENGALRGGTTFPAVDSVRISLPGGGPVDEVFVPGGGDPPAGAGPGADDASEGAQPRPPGRMIDTVVVRVQWRDVAGNWSEPTELPVALLASAPQG
jgi:hypothetical protein